MKKNIALITGGFTGESVISLKSAAQIEQNLDAAKFEVYKIIISPESWYYEFNGQVVVVDKNDFSLVVGGKKILFDAVFVGLHGSPGEDGKLQGYFDMLGIPYTSCDALTSAISMNKGYTKAIVADIPDLYVAKSCQFFADKAENTTIIEQSLKLPYFVKPNNGGSSFGISKVNQASELPAALEKAFKEDTQILVEEFISGREFTIGVFKSKGKITVLPITEIKTENEFFDYEAKYQGKSKEITPADITTKMFDTLTAAAQKVYAILNCRGVVRIDFIYDEAAEKAYMLEVNTVPGQSEASVIPQQVKAMGWNLTDFYGWIIEDSLEQK